MSTVEQFMRQALPLDGLSAWGALTPEGAFVGELVGDWLWLEQVEQLTRKLRTSCESLSRHGLEGSAICWAYERARLYACLRADKSLLVLLVESKASALSGKYNLLLTDFSKSA